MRLLRVLLVFSVLGCGGDNDAGIPSFIDVSGRWEGSATFRNNCVNYACVYQGSMNPPSVIIELEQVQNILEGTITINLSEGDPQIDDWNCQALQGSIVITRAQSSISGTQVTLTQSDFLGVWELQVVGTSGPQSSMQGTVSNTAPGCTGLVSDNISVVRRN